MRFRLNLWRAFLGAICLGWGLYLTYGGGQSDRFEPMILVGIILCGFALDAEEWVIVPPKLIPDLQDDPPPEDPKEEVKQEEKPEPKKTEKPPPAKRRRRRKVVKE